MKKIIVLIALLVNMLSAFSQVSSKEKAISGNYEYKTECMGVELDGSQTLKAWGNGRNRFDAIEQAKKNAVRDVLFKGIYEGKQDCEKRPLVVEPNAETKYREYFEAFFADGGAYKKFVNFRDTRILNWVFPERRGARKSVTYGVIVRVLRSQLRKKLVEDQIISN
jgi:hypothetical protein